MSSQAHSSETPAPRLSLVVPVLDEAENILPLIAEIVAVFGDRHDYEIVFVDDASVDETRERLAEASARLPCIRVIRHTRQSGVSAGLVTGVRAARAPTIVTLDGDGQNDPADIPTLLAAFESHGRWPRVLVVGHRQRRRDGWVKRFSSRLANAVRARVLGDGTPDTASGLRVFDRQTFLDMPAFDHMHRFLPALMIRQGGEVVSIPVNHRPRTHGRSKFGTFDRLYAGIPDLIGVMWLQRRARTSTADTEPPR